MNLEDLIEQLTAQDPKLLKGAHAIGGTIETMFMNLVKTYGTDDPGKVLGLLMAGVLAMNIAIEGAMHKKVNF